MEKIYEYQLDINSSIAPARLVRMVGRGKTVLEIGCSSGASSRAMRDSMQCTVTGLEIFAEAAAIAGQYCSRVIVGNVETMDLAGELAGQIFDVITFGDVLEHLRDPLGALIKIKPLLAPEGYIVVSVPNITHFSVAFELLNGRFDYRKKGLLDDTHIRFFTAKSLLKILSDAGLYLLEFERSVVEPEYTEFQTSLFGPEHAAILEYARKNNPELFTYQFVAKAAAMPRGTSVSIDAIEAREAIADLKILLAKSEGRTATLQAQIDWLESRWPIRVFKRISRLISGKR